MEVPEPQEGQWIDCEGVGHPGHLIRTGPMVVVCVVCRATVLAKGRGSHRVAQEHNRLHLKSDREFVFTPPAIEVGVWEFSGENEKLAQLVLEARAAYPAADGSLGRRMTDALMKLVHQKIQLTKCG